MKRNPEDLMERPAQSSGFGQSPWTASEPALWFPALDGNRVADVVIVGAGISGITTAYLLARSGADVIVLDDGPIGGGETGRTTAHLSNALDHRYFELIDLHSEDKTRMVAESHTEA